MTCLFCTDQTNNEIINEIVNNTINQLMETHSKHKYISVLYLIKNNHIVKIYENDPTHGNWVAKLIDFCRPLYVHFYWQVNSNLYACYLSIYPDKKDFSNCSIGVYQASVLNERYKSLLLKRVELTTEKRVDRTCTYGSPYPYPNSISAIPEPDEYTVAYEDPNIKVEYNTYLFAMFAFKICG